MNCKFGPLEIELTKDPKFKDQYESAMLPGGFTISCYKSDWQSAPWHAELDGPWYSDSSPEGSGETAEEAMAKLFQEVSDLIERFTQLHEAIKAGNAPPHPTPEK